MSNSKNSDNSTSKVKKNSNGSTIENKQPSEKKEPSKSYIRGESQKPVNVKYRKNWEKIFFNKNK